METSIFSLNSKDFGKQLRNARENKGYNLTEFSHMLGIPKSSESCYENGTTVPSLEKTCAMAELLEVSLDTLAGRNVFQTIGKPIENMLDIAVLVNKLCEYENIDLISSSKGKTTIEISNEVLAKYYEDRQYYQDIIKQDEAHEKEIKRIAHEIEESTMEKLATISVSKK